MKKLYILLSLTLFSFIIVANEIDRSAAKKVAVNFFYERISQYEHIDHSQISVSEVFELETDGQVLLYAVNIKGSGYVLVSTCNMVKPVAGYSLKGKYSGSGIPPQMQDLLTQYKRQIMEAANMP